MNETRRITNWVGYNQEATRAVFCAALQGIVANKEFFGSTLQGNPRAAVEFANEVALEFFTQQNLNK